MVMTLSFTSLPVQKRAGNVDGVSGNSVSDVENACVAKGSHRICHVSTLKNETKRQTLLICQFQANTLRIHSLLCLCRLCNPDRKDEVSLLISEAAFPHYLHEQ